MYLFFFIESVIRLTKPIQEVTQTINWLYCYVKKKRFFKTFSYKKLRENDS